MRHPILLQATALALVLGWSQSQAAEGKYPAAHFEPEVIYQAAETTPAATPAGGSAYPAAYFQPEVVYQDQDLIKAVGPQPAQTPVTARTREPGQAQVSSSRKTAPAGAVSDVAPPYGMLAFALGIVGLAFWWSSRDQASTAKEGDSQGGDEPEPEAAIAEPDAANDDTGEEDELEVLAEAAEANLAHTNRQRANKTRRVRRR